ncbi:MAG: UvrD-helicase domain-containing protein [Bacteroidota bacterium]|nr:UvrD-helicase domain-containing protein [Bacteroidota bacterium]
MSLTVYKSSAGSGKTFTLVREYLKLVIADPSSFRHILGVTFTNKAANEMKQRVIDYLDMLAEHDKHKGKFPLNILLPDLTAASALSEAEVADRARKVLGSILHNYSEFAIGTIDSFVHRIVRTFAHDLFLPMNFEVELDEDELVSRAVDLLISTIGTDEKLTAILVDFTLAKVEQEKNWHIDKDLRSFAKSLLKEGSQLHVDRLKNLTRDDFIRINDQLKKTIIVFENEVVKSAKEALEIIKNAGLNAVDFYQSTKGIYPYFARIASANFSALDPNSYVLKTIEEDKWISGKCGETEAASINNIKGELTWIYRDLQQKIQSGRKLYEFSKILYNRIYPMAVLNEISAWMDEIRRSDNILHISEFNKRIAEVVLNEPVPFVYERLGEKFRYFLIDEFQDTSVLQWQNMLPLLENSLANNNFNLLVGDGKQAIYRWRNGNVEQFANLPAITGSDENPILKSRETILRQHFQEDVLEWNYRSAKDIVEFNNEFFDAASELIEEPWKKIYRDHRQIAGKEDKRGYVNICLFDKDDPLGFHDFNLERIMWILDDLKAGNFSLQDTAVICRSNKEANRVAEFLLEKDIPVVSSESLLLGNSAQLNFVVGFIRYLQDPADKINTAHLLAFLQLREKSAINSKILFALNSKAGPKDLFDTAGSPGMKLKEAMEEMGFRFSAAYLKSLSIYDLCEEIIRIFSFNHHASPFIQFFLDAVFDFTRKKNPAYDAFLDWWEEKKNDLSIVLPENMNAVRILTIHKAKGLEFPAVIYPFANNLLKASMGELWVELQTPMMNKLDTAYLKMSSGLLNTDYSQIYEEEMKRSLLDLVNLLYVVMTRPTDRLYIISEKPPKNSSSVSIQTIIDHFLISKALKDDSKEEYEFGLKAEKSSERKSGEKTEQIHELISADWRERLLLSTRAPDYWDTENMNSAAEYGKLVHQVFAEINSVNDLDDTINSFVLHGMIDEQEADSLRKSIVALINDPLLAPCFAPGVRHYAEKEILLPGGEAYRPDRVVFFENETVLIDYKTGGRERSHEKQIRQYASLLAEMGYKNVKCRLVYVNDPAGAVEV